jgi:hypothetical protein
MTRCPLRQGDVDTPALPAHGPHWATAPSLAAWLIHPARDILAVQLPMLERGHAEIEEIPATIRRVPTFLIQAPPTARLSDPTPPASC